MATGLITEKEIRMFMMDKPESNTLIDGVKFDSELIEQCQLFVVDYYNMMPPPTGTAYTVENFPSRVLMTIGTVARLLMSAAIGDTMNELEYAVDGVQINDRSHGKAFQDLGTMYWQEFMEMAKNVKISKNIEKLFGTKNSEYNHRAFYW